MRNTFMAANLSSAVRVQPLDVQTLLTDVYTPINTQMLFSIYPHSATAHKHLSLLSELTNICQIIIPQMQLYDIF